jgi:hypothetical protein
MTVKRFSTFLSYALLYKYKNKDRSSANYQQPPNKKPKKSHSSSAVVTREHHTIGSSMEGTVTVDEKKDAMTPSTIISSTNSTTP